MEMRIPARVMVLAVGVMLLATAVLPREVGAEAVNPRQAMETQKAVCEALGGTATTEQQQLSGTNIDVATKVSCSGGLLDGMTCTNAVVNNSSKCSLSSSQTDDGTVWGPINGHLHDLQPVEALPPSLLSTVDVHAVMAGLEAGMTAAEILPDVQAPPAGGPDLAPDNGQPDSHVDTGKKRGHGHSKKHGKGRKH
jgi:hypothetical protein